MAIKLVGYVPLEIKVLEIEHAEFGGKFWKALIQRVGECNFEKLSLYKNKIDDNECKELGVRLAEVIAANNSIEELRVWYTKLMVANNVKQWGEVFMRNNTLTKFSWYGATKDINIELRQLAKKHRKNLDMDAFVSGGNTLLG